MLMSRRYYFIRSGGRLSSERQLGVDVGPDRHLDIAGPPRASAEPRQFSGLLSAEEGPP